MMMMGCGLILCWVVMESLFFLVESDFMSFFMLISWNAAEMVFGLFFNGCAMILVIFLGYPMRACF